jgi:hypothetical protein
LGRVALSYDELPEGSDLRRDYRAGGAVTVTAPAGEPSVAARRSLAHRTGVFSAVVCTACMGMALWTAWPAVIRLDAGLRATAAVLFAVLAGGSFLLVWKVGYGARLDLLADACRETVVLHADPRGLVIETAGPRGGQSLDLPAGEIRAIRSAVEIRGTGFAGGRLSAGSIPCLEIDRATGPALRLLAGRHPAELHWVAATLSQALRSSH